MREFSVDIAETRLQAIRDRLAAFRWDAMPGIAGWGAGASRSFMADVADHWLNRFDWRAQEAALNRFPQFIAPVDGMDLHFYHVRSPEPAARPLLLLHGWPGSVFEFLHIIELLIDPRRHGGDPADAFHVVVPSLPGYGFSGRPAQPIGPAEVARLLARLMVDVLGYDSYVAQGGDWGAVVSSMIGYQDRDHCLGIHLNMLVPHLARPTVGEDEAAWLARFLQMQRAEGAYGQVQMTKPQSLGFAMADSPLGIAAWIIEKFARWSDLPRDAMGEPDLLACYTYDQLLTNVMIYLAQDSFVTSTWLYHGYAATMRDLPFAQGRQCPAPTGVAAFPDPVFEPQPRSMAERNYNVVHWTAMPRGGHFAALEAPELLVRDVRAFVRKIA